MFNKHYDYATADEMMKRITVEYRRFMYGIIIRDGGNLLAIGETNVLQRETRGIEEILNEILSEYSNPKDKEKMVAMKNEVMIKKAITRQRDFFGKIKLYKQISITEISRNTKLADVVRRAL